MSRFYRSDKIGIQILFGKYEGKYLHDIDDVGYLKWILREHVEKSSFDEHLVVEVEEELKVRGESLE